MIKNIILIFIALVSLTFQINATEIRMIVSTPAGNGVDIVGRIVAKYLEKELDTIVIVENKPGVAGTIAAQHVLNSPSTPTHVLFSNAGIVSAPNILKSVSYDVKKDFIPVAIINENPEILLTKGDRFKDVNDFITQSKKSILPFKCGVIGVGSGSDFISKDFVKKSGIVVDNIPYNSVNTAILDIIAGRIDFIMATIPTTYPFIIDKKLDALAQMAPTRKIDEIVIPSIKEYNIQSYINWWNGILVAATTPPETVNKLRAAIQRIKKNPEFITAMAKIHGDVSPNLTDYELNKFIIDDINIYKRMIEK